MTARRRPLAWGLLVASGVSILVVGLAYTGLILAGAGVNTAPIPPAFWTWGLAACCLTIASLSLRALRWVFLLRRSEVRIPIGDSFVGYHAGLSLLFAPFLLGEIAVRAFVLRARGSVPVAITCALNLWERYLDMVALALMAALTSPRVGRLTLLLLAFVAASFLPPVRELVLRIFVALVDGVTARVLRSPVRTDRATFRRLTGNRAWLVAVVTSVLAWTLPCAAFWGLAQSWGHPFSAGEGFHAYAASALTGGVVLAPGGILIVGESLLEFLQNRAGFPAMDAAVTVLSIRVATAGLATAMGVLFVLVHLRSGKRSAASHFDELAPAYTAQIPESRRLALLSKKTGMMARVLAARHGGTRGLDVGCGPGWYVGRMREMGFDVRGIDDSAGQVESARRNLGDAAIVDRGSMLDIPAPAASYDFVYCINVLHHLPSVMDQQAAFEELLRVLRPGGILFVHEINTRNVLFRLYMGYLFPLLNCIDEGIERWLPPHRLAAYTRAPVLEIEYFTFLPEFVPAAVVRLLRPLERVLEASPLRRYSAHYMAVLQKPEVHT